MTDVESRQRDSRQRDYDGTVGKYIRRNVTAQLINGAFGMTGFRLVQAPTFLPAYLFGLTGSEFLVGMARALQASGTVLSPLIGASAIGHRPRIMGALLWFGVLMRLPVLGMAAAGFLLAADLKFVATVMMMTVMGFFLGMSQITVNTLRAKVIPVQRRGMVAGWRNFLGGLMSAAVSYVAGVYILEQNLFGDGYATLFCLAFGLGMIGLLGLLISREPEAVMTRPRESVPGTLRAVPGLLRANPAFARFFVVRAMGSFGMAAMPFYILFAGTHMTISGAQLGIVTTLWMVTSSTTNLLWGNLADRMGYRIVLIMTLSLWALANVQIVFVTDFTSLLVFFTVVGMAQGGFNQSGQNMVLELGAVEDIPLRLAVSGTAVNAIAAVGPLVGGLVVVLWRYEAVFIGCAVLQALALLVLVRFVPEPRRSAHQMR